MFDSKSYCDKFQRAVIPFVQEAIALGGIQEHRGSEVLLAWIAGFAAARASVMADFRPWTLEHTRRCFDIARLVYETQSETS